MTPESVQAMIDQALLRNSTNKDGSHSSHGDNRRNVQTTRPCFYADFMKCQPLNFKENEGIVGLTRWIEKMESIFNISGCAIENQSVDPTTYKANRNNANDGTSGSAGGVEYTARGCSYKEFLNCKPHNFDKTEGAVGLTKWFEKLESVFNIFNCVEICQVKYATCTLLDGALTWWNAYVQSEAICVAHDLMDQVVRAKVANDADNKRKWEDGQRRNSLQNKRHEVVRAYDIGSSDKKGYAETLPLYDKCNIHHHHEKGHTRKCCQELENQNRAGEACEDPNVVMDLRVLQQARENLMETIQAFLKEYDHIPPEEKCMALLLVEERFLKINQAIEEEQNQPEVMQELVLKLMNDLQILKGIQPKQAEQEEPAAQSFLLNWNFPMADDDEYTII
ncbi:hypothetical protein Tco_0407134 [Tanacetum coccineum]